MNAIAEVISWWAFVLKYEAREMWRALPGPWWCKLLIIIVLQAIPGELDEILLLVVLSALRKRRARIAAAQMTCGGAE
jgi:hypothetical protein